MIKAELTELGIMIFTSSTPVEAYAVKCWVENIQKLTDTNLFSHIRTHTSDEKKEKP